MLILIAVVAIVVTVLGVWIKMKTDEMLGMILTVASIAVFVFSLILIFPTWSEIATEYVLDEKILMYEEENRNIEERIDVLVANYLEYEQETFAEFKVGDKEDIVTLVSLFPELKSNTLVQEQLEVYVANNTRIKQLREQKIDISKRRWVLYFGK